MTDDSPRNDNIDAFAILAHGTGAVDDAQARRAFGLEPGCEDGLLARAVVRHVARGALPLLREPGSSSAPPRATDEPVVAPRASYILRLPSTGASTGLSVQSLDDVRTLILIIRAGGLFQRRAAVSRIGALLLADAVASSEVRKRAIDTLTEQRHLDLGYEASQALAALPGSDGRAARADQRSRHELAARVEARVLSFWEGEESQEPIGQLSAEQRAQLLARARELSDVLIRHVAALVEDSGGLGTDTERRMLVSSLEHAGDPRLVPALRSLLLAQDAAVFEPCVRALARIEDARVPGLLRDAFDRASRSQERLLLAAALGRHGDTRGVSYARNVLVERDASQLVPALEALAELGGSDDVQPILELLEHENPAVARASVAALGRVADGRALAPLAELRGRVQRSALRADIEEAESAIAARTELLGEDPPSKQASSAALDTRRMLARVRTRDPAIVRARARLYNGFAYIWLLFGAVQRAVARFEAAAALRPGWLAPVLALALLYARLQQNASALSAFRRALDIDRAELEADSGAVTALATTFLRRAEAMEREGRLDIARGLIEEALSYDLRRARPEVRLGLTERREAHRMRER
jgi:tetratricopeptide (TPR) repeat protein